MSDSLLTPEQVAERLQMSREWVIDHATRRQPRIPSVRLGSQRAVLRFRPKDVDDFIAKNPKRDEVASRPFAAERHGKFDGLGVVQRHARKRGPDVWVHRWTERTPAGVKRRYLLVGQVGDFENERAAHAYALHLRRTYMEDALPNPEAGHRNGLIDRLICDNGTYEKAVWEQDGKCAVCLAVAKLDADHDHNTGKFRALLCGPCNRAIGLMRDDPVRLRAAADYLEKHRG